MNLDALRHGAWHVFYSARLALRARDAEFSDDDAEDEAVREAARFADRAVAGMAAHAPQEPKHERLPVELPEELLSSYQPGIWTRIAWMLGNPALGAAITAGAIVGGLALHAYILGSMIR